MDTPRAIEEALVLHRAGRTRDAEQALRDVINAAPASVPAWGYLASLLLETQRLAESEQCWRRVVELLPTEAPAWNQLGMLLAMQQKFAEAIDALRRATRIDPKLVPAWRNLARALGLIGQLDQSLDALQHAAQLAPNDPNVQLELSQRLRQCTRLAEAVAAAQRAIQISPNPALAAAHNALGLALLKQAKPQDAFTSLRRACELAPRDRALYSDTLVAFHYLPGVDAQVIFGSHMEWSLRYADVPAIDHRSHDFGAARRLRIAFVSPDLRAHSVAFFIQPLFEQLDRGSFELFAYSDVAAPDATTLRLQHAVDRWRDTASLSDDQLLEQIRSDHIDILVDLAGHTAGNRLTLFVRKPAPLQLTYLGYPDTTGLPQIDYRITDAIADPPGAERFHTERLLRLPHTAWCYQPPDSAPDIADRAPAPITFGSFNNLAKLNDELIALWVRLLNQTPQSRLLLKAPSLQDAATRADVLARFTSHNIEADRLCLLGPDITHASHLAAYNDIDIALDTFPYHGTTTTCEALWMGVPVIALAGNTHVSRVGVSLLSSVGLNDLVASSPDDYVRLAASLARDTARLHQLRRTLRDRMRHSPLLDRAAFARDFGDAIRDAWRDALASQSLPRPH